MTSTLERLDTDFKIPFDEQALLSKDPVLITRYMLELAQTLQLLLEKITTAANYAIDLADGDAVYYALRDSDGEYPDGTWRRIQVGDNLEDQVLINSVWTFVQKRERPV